MPKTANARVWELVGKTGIPHHEMHQLRQDALRLRRWYERECNGEVERSRDGSCHRPINVNGPGPIRYVPARDMETGALERIARIMANHPEFVAYHQTDPRGCSLYLIPVERIPAGAGTEWISCNYPQGFAIY